MILKSSRHILITSITVALFFLMSGLFGSNTAQAEGIQLNTAHNVPIIMVSSTGSVSVVPDQAQVSMAVIKKDPNLAQALAFNNLTAEKLINALKQAGIESKDIKTANFNVYPQYNYSKNEAAITGYEIRNELTVTVKDLDKLVSILDLAVNTGANNLNYITFQKADISAEKNAALTQAINRAREKAAMLARAVDKNLGNVVSIDEDYTQPSHSISADMLTAGAGGSAAIPVIPGDISITAHVTIVYEME